MEEGFQNFPAEWYMEVQSHRKALDPYSQQMIKELFDGAETVHVKVGFFGTKVNLAGLRDTLGLQRKWRLVGF
jgi:hypothetical protein